MYSVAEVNDLML